MYIKGTNKNRTMLLRCVTDQLFCNLFFITKCVLDVRLFVQIELTIHNVCTADCIIERLAQEAKHCIYTCRTESKNFAQSFFFLGQKQSLLYSKDSEPNRSQKQISAILQMIFVSVFPHFSNYNNYLTLYISIFHS